MCPDRQILSLYVDNELPSPWKEKLEAHLFTCEQCKSNLAQYHSLNAVLEEDKIEISPELKNRVWDKVAQQRPEGLYDFSLGRRIEFTPVKRRNAFWNRSVSLPFPAVAAAAAAFIIITFLAIQGIQGPVNVTTQVPGIIAGIGTDAQSMFPASDMSSVFQYLSGDDMADFVIINLPETRSFYSSGEPALLKAADYSRRASSR